MSPTTCYLLHMLFSGDVEMSYREAAEQIMLERGWIDSLLFLLHPPPGDLGIRYKGIKQ
jgi:hypothetical protein